MNKTEIMNATEAREIAEKSLYGIGIEPYCKIIDRKIKEAAESGRMSVCQPFFGEAIDCPCEEQLRAIFFCVSNKGYKIKRIQGSYGFMDFIEISW